MFIVSISKAWLVFLLPHDFLLPGLCQLAHFWSLLCCIFMDVLDKAIEAFFTKYDRQSVSCCQVFASWLTYGVCFVVASWLFWIKPLRHFLLSMTGSQYLRHLGFF